MVNAVLFGLARKGINMGFFSRFFKKVEAVNKGTSQPEELKDEFYLSAAEMAMDSWREMEQNLLVNAVKAVSQPVERAFVLVNFKSDQACFELFYQVEGRLLRWTELDSHSQEKIRTQLLPQAPEVANYINQQFLQAGEPEVSYAMLQLEQASLAWFARTFYDNMPESRLPFTGIVEGWYNILKEKAPHQDLASDNPLPYFEL